MDTNKHTSLILRILCELIAINSNKTEPASARGLGTKIAQLQQINGWGRNVVQSKENLSGNKAFGLFFAQPHNYNTTDNKFLRYLLPNIKNTANNCINGIMTSAGILANIQRYLNIEGNSFAVIYADFEDTVAPHINLSNYHEYISSRAYMEIPQVKELLKIQELKELEATFIDYDDKNSGRTHSQMLFLIMLGLLREDLSSLSRDISKWHKLRPDSRDYNNFRDYNTILNQPEELFLEKRVFESHNREGYVELRNLIDGIDSGKDYLIYGKSGIGKTMLQVYLHSHMLPKQKLSVYISKGEFQGSTTLIEWLEEYFKMDGYDVFEVIDNSPSGVVVFIDDYSWYTRSTRDMIRNDISLLREKCLPGRVNFVVSTKSFDDAFLGSKSVKLSLHEKLDVDTVEFYMQHCLQDDYKRIGNIPDTLIELLRIPQLLVMFCKMISGSGTFAGNPIQTVVSTTNSLQDSPVSNYNRMEIFHQYFRSKISNSDGLQELYIEVILPLIAISHDSKTYNGYEMISLVSDKEYYLNCAMFSPAFRGIHGDVVMGCSLSNQSSLIEDSYMAFTYENGKLSWYHDLYYDYYWCRGVAVLYQFITMDYIRRYSPEHTIEYMPKVADLASKLRSEDINVIEANIQRGDFLFESIAHLPRAVRNKGFREFLVSLIRAHGMLRQRDDEKAISNILSFMRLSLNQDTSAANLKQVFKSNNIDNAKQLLGMVYALLHIGNGTSHLIQLCIDLCRKYTPQNNVNQLIRLQLEETAYLINRYRESHYSQDLVPQVELSLDACQSKLNEQEHNDENWLILNGRYHLLKGSFLYHKGSYYGDNYLFKQAIEEHTIVTESIPDSRFAHASKLRAIGCEIAILNNINIIDSQYIHGISQIASKLLDDSLLEKAAEDTAAYIKLLKDTKELYIHLPEPDNTIIDYIQERITYINKKYTH